MFKIKGQVQNAAWGDLDAIARIVGFEPNGEPQAEYWLGAHPKAPSEIVDDVGSAVVTDRSLEKFIAANPVDLLGVDVAERFGELPFLLKILAAAKPLSIQAHPSLDQARDGFARENDAGIDLGARVRSYKDPNHKPEMICALTPFEAKCGLRPVAELLDLLSLFGHNLIVHWRRLLERSAETGDPAALKEAVEWLLRLDDGTAAELVDALASETRTLVDDAGADAGRYFSELTWTLQIAESFPGDIGVAVALMLNHLTLQPGEAMYLGSGNLHAYLSGVGIELMANSDNVLRGGLTSKHIDVDELLSVVCYEPLRPPVQRPTSQNHRFDTPIPEFSLTRVIGPGFRPEDGPPNEPISIDVTMDGPEIVLVTDGSVKLVAMSSGDLTRSGNGSLAIGSGEAAFVPAIHGSYRVTVDSPRTVLWRATTG